MIILILLQSAIIMSDSISEIWTVKLGSISIRCELNYDIHLFTIALRMMYQWDNQETFDKYNSFVAIL